MQTAVGNLHKVSVSGKLTVMATFGKTFFRLSALEAGRSYDWTALRNARYPDDVQSAWSNTCDLKSSAMNSLLNTLKNVAPETTAPVLRMIVFLSIQSQKARAEFIYQNDMWEFKETRILADEYAYHDIILDNEMSFRVKVFSELYPDANSLWSSVKNMIQFQKQASGDPFDTKPTLASDAPRGLSIQHVCTQNVHAVANFHGLRFQTLQGRGRDSLEIVTLEVRPPEDMLKKKQAGESLAFLVQTLVEILDPSP
ncbi:hypothetical protein PHMEG_00036110 [Phytophthora megakarya]|uniref:Uncharacterized protein n=1 Tax=Phytophthora megakarya TaxID=4795 RepID=A0A225UML3_9STRA|nr:hypothetical protein PHMEG_00036110 [Phytophthora megakarya]